MKTKNKVSTTTANMASNIEADELMSKNLTKEKKMKHLKDVSQTLNLSKERL